MSEKRAAVFSSCRTWRYTLRRDVGSLLSSGRGACMFLMLNPSTADETQDDRTVRRCRGFAEDWGFDELLIGNAFAYRATKPADLAAQTYEVALGPENVQWVRRLIAEAARVVVAWGASVPKGLEIGYAINAAVEEADAEVVCLGHTRSYAPRHPLYVAGDVEPEPWGAEPVPTQLKEGSG